MATSQVRASAPVTLCRGSRSRRGVQTKAFSSSGSRRLLVLRGGRTSDALFSSKQHHQHHRHRLLCEEEETSFSSLASSAASSRRRTSARTRGAAAAGTTTAAAADRYEHRLLCEEDETSFFSSSSLAWSSAAARRRTSARTRGAAAAGTTAAVDDDGAGVTAPAADRYEHPPEVYTSEAGEEVLMQFGEGMRIEELPEGTRVAYPGIRKNAPSDPKEMQRMVEHALDNPIGQPPLREKLRALKAEKKNPKILMAFDDVSIPARSSASLHSCIWSNGPFIDPSIGPFVHSTISLVYSLSS